LARPDKLGVGVAREMPGVQNMARRFFFTVGIFFFTHSVFFTTPTPGRFPQGGGEHHREFGAHP
jgi:hypothetical protein